MDPAAFLREVTAPYVSAPPPGIVVREEHDDAPRVRIDRRILARAVVNLIANAIDHNEGADGLVVEIGREARGGESLLYVRDNGKGIDPALHERIFEPFRRGEDSKEGLGLGLALVEAVVSHAGGRVFVESQPGTGATVFFTIPDTAECESP